MIPIFKQEKQDNLTEEILSKPSVSYLMPIQDIQPKKIELFATASQDHIKKLFGDETDYSSIDLYDMSSLLVSTVWNGNDDYFDRKEVWGARHTPVHKPLNVEHKCDDIVGHTIGVCSVDDNLNLILDDCSFDELPSVYHLLSRAVLYTYWSESDKQDRMNRIIKEINEKKWCVSVEALFNNFDYAVKCSGNEIKIVERNDKTSFLTKHLRWYGGSGEYNGYKIGRVIRNIIFSGKGIVKTPANPQSIIFAKKHDFDNVVYLSTAKFLQNEVNKMEKELKDQVTKLEATLKDNETKFKDLQNALNSKDGEIADLKDKFSKLEASFQAANAENTATRTKLDETEKTVAALTEEKNQAVASLQKIEAEKKYNDRLNSLVGKCSIDGEKAKKLLDVVVGMNDESFNIFLDTQSELLKASQVTLTDSQKADTKVLENINKNDNKDPALNTKVDNSGVEKLRASIDEYLTVFLGIKTEDKKEV